MILFSMIYRILILLKIKWIRIYKKMPVNLVILKNSTKILDTYFAYHKYMPLQLFSCLEFPPLLYLEEPFASASWGLIVRGRWRWNYWKESHENWCACGGAKEFEMAFEDRVMEEIKDKKILWRHTFVTCETSCTISIRNL